MYVEACGKVCKGRRGQQEMSLEGRVKDAVRRGAGGCWGVLSMEWWEGTAVLTHFFLLWVAASAAGRKGGAAGEFRGPGLPREVRHLPYLHGHAEPPRAGRASRRGQERSLSAPDNIGWSSRPVVLLHLESGSQGERRGPGVAVSNEG